MTKRIALALLLVAGTAGAASAQSISANASVSKSISNTEARGLVFGAGTPGGSGGSTVGATHVAVNATGPQMGYAEYRYNTAGQVGVSAPGTLLNSDDLTSTITVSFTCGVANSSATSLTLGACGTHVLPYDGAGMDFMRLWLGGTIAQADLDAAKAGSYSATITLTATTP